MAKRSFPAAGMFLTLVLAIVLVFGMGSSSPAKSVRTIKVSMVSYKFVPEILKFNEGDRVIIQLSNDDTRPRAHAIASPYLSTVDLTVRGQAKVLVTPDGWKSVQLDQGQKAEVEFVARGHGQWVFICPVFNHASNGETGAFIVWPAGYQQ